jgi:hypothetical protein
MADTTNPGEPLPPSDPKPLPVHPLVTYLRELADGLATLDAHKLRAAANMLDRLHRSRRDL